MANPFPFVSGSVLLAAELNGIGEVTAYTPTFTNLTVGNGTVVFSFIRVQTFVSVRGQVTLGSTSSVGTNPALSLPVTAASYPANQFVGHARLLDASPLVSLLGLTQINDTTTAGVRRFQVVGSDIVTGAINATTPITWATSDSIQVQFVYEAA